MKKLILLSVLAAVLSITSYAQTRVGLFVAPELSYGKIIHDPETIESDGTTLLAKFGLEFDSYKADNWAFSTGITFSPKRLSITGTLDGQTLNEEYKIQYLQIPLTVKLFTSEIQPDLKAYFQLGFMGEILVFSEEISDDNVLIDDFRFFDTSFTGGAGVEYGAGVNTVIYGGIFYDMGLVNVVSDQNNDIDGDLMAKMRAFSLKVGLKF